MNAKEIVSVGLKGQKTKKIIALVPVSLLKVDHKSYQREEKKHIIRMSKEWDDTQLKTYVTNTVLRLLTEKIPQIIKK